MGDLSEAITKGEDDELEAIAHLELVEDGREVMANGGVADEEAFGDLLIREPLADEPDDLAFTNGEARYAREDLGRYRGAAGGL